MYISIAHLRKFKVKLEYIYNVGQKKNRTDLVTMQVIILWKIKMDV